MAFKRSIIASASEDRLENLILERLKPGADKERIDQRIWDLFGEVWCIMFTDLSGFSRGVEKFGIIHFLQTIHESERILVPVIEDHDGILLKSEGDSFLVIFRNVAKGLQAAIRMQKELVEYNKNKIPEEKILLCVGLGYGKVLKIGDIDVFGSEVNTASKLGEDTAEAGEILLTQSVFDNAENLEYKFEPIQDVPAGTTGAYRLVY
ncbi:adenylate/guanylate cyclase domain-containing protein [Leptospira wolffii]|uniref:adenylate/guanylate cyclase domain-containing protein n=1 Tax=Leptospira wolffii TaxID=409998 RepID=UPI0003018441|nr:adenylate/guanylate cyclase domain-containing protein [Leptospira wolffii]EPG64599.1 adenylate/guanylate cyclase catalytic domain protein [Leptospira wolffii serovar Khorat str. Khorat-H2]TGK62448.1 adenylate/guanylate cyclase domain-containing protein [Leptospira wolffii]TGK65991.1 adenylate/guanylate cyclase domain-containing protein [Leptospira wolffii]TGK74168.1 adenylate/guanylate cyclase domain-containing protein [Leptospira wolffii]TGL29027.1 adenylate/guanylate cyclase domain-contai